MRAARYSEADIYIKDEALERWIHYPWDTLEDVGKSLERRVIQQFVAKIVVR